MTGGLDSAAVGVSSAVEAHCCSFWFGVSGGGVDSASSDAELGIDVGSLADLFGGHCCEGQSAVE